MTKRSWPLIFLFLVLSLANTANAQPKIDVGAGLTHFDARHTIGYYDTTITESFSIWSVLVAGDVPILSFGHDISMGLELSLMLGFGDSVGYGDGRLLLTVRYGASASSKTNMRFGATLGLGEAATDIARSEEAKYFVSTLAMIEGDWVVAPKSWNILKLRLTKSLISGKTTNAETHVTSQFSGYGIYLTYQINL